MVTDSGDGCVVSGGVYCLSSSSTFGMDLQIDDGI